MSVFVSPTNWNVSSFFALGWERKGFWHSIYCLENTGICYIEKWRNFKGGGWVFEANVLVYGQYKWLFDIAEQKLEQFFFFLHRIFFRIFILFQVFCFFVWFF